MDTPTESLPEPEVLRQADTKEGTRRRLRTGHIVCNRYEVLEKLGRGSKGEVWRVYDQKLRVEVALKALRRTTPADIEALRQEVRTAREIISPNVCRIFDLAVEEDQELISMEFIDGRTLISLLQEKSPLNFQDAFEIASQLLAGLSAIHQAGLVHRDLKPENIMITKTGRVVVMDFGIAKTVDQLSGTFSGTPPYMAPEQITGGRVDARSDIFAAGVLLAEMVSPIQDHTSREKVWNAIREDVSKLPKTPWLPVIAKATARVPDNRFSSAAELSRALEKATQNETNNNTKPYPGLFSFTENDSEYFFGREMETELLLNKVQQLHMLAVIGPSGAGKTSFLRAGLVTALPSRWGHVITQPGDAPLSNLGQSLAAEFSGDTEAIRKMVKLNDLDTALWLLQRWRKKYADALLIVDRFEELFTLNDDRTQAQFSELIGRAAIEADVRVLLAMRDDFLIFCKTQPALSPIFSDLTPLLPLSGPDLRRALTQPALQCGYRFEDDSLVDEILRDVEKERGALPLMAFAAAKLWEKRDSKNGLLSREAYRQTGGVGGALAQHAEATLDRIGSESYSIVREIFRNLITAQNTRTPRDVEEILSIFEDRSTAENVLRSLIDARLLNSFEAPSQEGKEKRRRVEIIHESLLSAWPRLVRWQTQDVESAQFRDLFHQAANVWDERGRPADLLWSGASYKEYELWRNRYSGKLTATEKAFADAMHLNSRRKRKRVVASVSTIFVILLTVLAVISALWRSEKTAREHASIQTQRAEASKLLAMGRAELDRDPTVALAYSIASLERADTAEGRRFALQALWKGPPAWIVPDVPVRPTWLNFSSDNQWLGVGGYFGSRLLPQDGSSETILTEGITKTHRPHLPLFSDNGEYAVWTSADNPSVVRIWSVPQNKEIRSFQFENTTLTLIRGSSLISITDISQKNDWTICRIRSWPFDASEPKIVGQWNRTNIKSAISNNIEMLAYARGRSFDISNDAKWLIFGSGKNIYLRPLEADQNAAQKLAAIHDHDVTAIRFHPDGIQFASADNNGEIRLWNNSQNPDQPARIIPANGEVWDLFFNKTGSIFAAGRDKKVYLWDLKGPLDAEPFPLLRGFDYAPHVAFDNNGQWAAVPFYESIAFWQLSQSYPYVLSGHGDQGAVLGFSDNGRQFVSSFTRGDIRIWDLSSLSLEPKVIENPAEYESYRMDLHPNNKFMALATNEGAFVISMEDGTLRRMPGIGAGVVSFSPNGRFLAAESYGNIPIWDLQTDQVQNLKLSKEMSDAVVVAFSTDNALLSGHKNGNIYYWNLDNQTSKLIATSAKSVLSVVPARKNPNIAACLWVVDRTDVQNTTTELRIIDLRTAKQYPIETHGNRVSSAAIDPSGKILVTGDMDGTVRVGPITGEEPHLLYGHEDIVISLAVHPDLKWIASSENINPVVRLWPMPKGKPLHTLPYPELIKKLQSLTNVRIVQSEQSSTGYAVRIGSFPGWKKASSW